MMRVAIVSVIILAVMLVPAVPVLAQQQKPKTEPQPAAQPNDPDYAGGTVVAVTAGTPLVLTVRANDVSDSVRPMKREGRITVEIPAQALRGIPAPKVGDSVVLTGIVRDGKFIVRNVTVNRK